MGEPLTDGINLLKLQVTDEHNNLSEIVEIEFTLDTKSPEILVELANDTGDSDTDKLTADPTIIGKVIDASKIISLTASLNETNVEKFQEITEVLETDGNLELNPEILAEILGDVLTDRTYNLYLQATDEHNNSSEIVEIEFTLKTETEQLGPEIISLAEIYGLDTYPDAIALTPTSARQLSVKIDGWVDSPELTTDIEDITYTIADGDIVEISDSGLITATGVGETTITFEYGEVSATIPVLVDEPETAAAIIDENGGIVEGSDGELVMIPPGALTEETLVNITPLQQQDLSLPVPEGFEFATAFNLEIEDDKLDIPAQLAIPAPEGLETGTEVWFMRKGALPDETGTWNDIWLQEESGVVDADGFIRTTSPPYPGIVRPGEYMVIFSGLPGSATLVKGQLTQTTNVPLAFFGIIDPNGDIGQLIDPDSFVTAFSVTYDISSVDVIAIPQVGLPVVTKVGVQRAADGLATFEANLNLLAPESDPTQAPVLQGAELKFNDDNGEPFADNEPVLFLTADNALIERNDLPTSTGSQFADLQVNFYVGEQVYSGEVLPSLSQEVDDNRVEVAVKVPVTMPLGSSRIALSRQQDMLVEQKGTEPVYEVIEFESNKLRLENDAEYVFTALAGADSVSVVDASNPEAVVNDTSSSDLALGRIPVGVDGVTDRPESLAITGDNSRVYVPLKNSSGVAVVDPMVLSQVDNLPETPDVTDPIPLPDGAKPVDIALGLRDEYAYIADESKPKVYVLDIDPFSSTYHQVVQTIELDAAGGLNRLAISSDGRRLFVSGKDGYIYAVNVDVKDKPQSESGNSNKWHEQIGRFNTEHSVMGVEATNNAGMMTFTSGHSSFDFKGFGVLEVTNDDPNRFSAELRYTTLGLLGGRNDYFSVKQPYGVTLTKDASYAFVTGRNFNALFDDFDNPPEVLNGGNIGIIQDPLGSNPQLVAATRPLPDRLTHDLVLSNDDKYLYVSNPTFNGSGEVLIFDVEEMIQTLLSPGDYEIDVLDRGVGSPFFDESTARTVTAADFESVPIDDINPDISIAADFEIVQEDRPRNQFVFGVPADSTRGPVAVGGNPRGIAITGGDWLDLEVVDLIEDGGAPDLTPMLEWDFDGVAAQEISEVNLFVSVFDEGNGLLPWDNVVDLSGPVGNAFLASQGLTRQEQLELLSEPWNVSFYGQEDDFNPNRILTATWQRDPDDGIGKWTYDGGKTWIEGVNTSFTLPENRTLTAGQTYHWAVETFSDNELHPELEFGQFTTEIPSALNGDDTFRSVSLLTHGFQFPNTASGVPERFYDLADRIANFNSDSDGLILRYEPATGYWVPVNEQGQVLLQPSGNNYLAELREFIAPKNPAPDQINYLESQTPVVLLADWSHDSGIPDSGFSEAAADSLFASLVQLDQLLMDEDNDATQGPVLNSPLHLISFSRGTVVNSEIVQRLGTYFPEAGGKPGTGQRDLQMTTLDPHDFDQPGLSLLGINSFTDFREPKVQVWESVTFADNYYQTVPNLLGNSFTPAGRDLPNLPATESGKTATGLEFPRQGWRSESPNPNAPLLGKPDLSVFLGTNKNEPDYERSRAGFTRETDPFYGFGGDHTRVPSWYAGTVELESVNFPNNEQSDEHGIYRQRSDGRYEQFFDRSFSYGEGVTNKPRVSPWYRPDHKKAGFNDSAEDAPSEGIGTGWFYSVLGGGKDLRTQTGVDKVPVDFDNTYDAHMRGDFAVPTLFNGNFDAVFNPKGTFRKSVSQEIPGWSFHGGESNSNNPTGSLVNWWDIPSLKEPRIIVGFEDGNPIRESYLQRLGIDSNSPAN